MGSESVKEAGERLTASEWRAVLACGDVRDRFPCASCTASSPKQCACDLPRSVIKSAGEYINGYGWRAAEELTAGRSTKDPSHD